MAELAAVAAAAVARFALDHLESSLAVVGCYSPLSPAAEVAAAVAVLASDLVADPEEYPVAAAAAELSAV